jgi:hypothetical protein
LPSDPEAGDTTTVVLAQDETGGRTAAWPEGTQWDGGAPPTLSSEGLERDVVTLLFDGTAWLGFLSGRFDAPPPPPLTPVITEDFAKTDSVLLQGQFTTTGAKEWFSGKGGWLGAGSIGAAPTSGRIATADASNGMCAGLVVDEADVLVEVDYDLSVGSASARQVRVGARGGSSKGGAAIVKGNGDVQIEFFGSGGSTVTLGGGAPNIGTIGVEAIGTTFRVYINGVQVGADQTNAVANGTDVAFATYGQNAALDNFAVTYLS